MSAHPHRNIFALPASGWLLAFACFFGQAVGALAADDLGAWRSALGETRQLVENDGLRAYREALRLQDTLPANATPMDRLQLLNVLSRVEVYLAYSDIGGQHAEQALTLAKQLGDRRGQAEAYLNITLNSTNQADMATLLAAPGKALEALNGVDYPELLVEALIRQSMGFRRQGKTENSVAMAVQAMEIAQRSHLPRAMTLALQGMAISYDQSGRPAEALKYFSQMRDWAQKTPSRLLEAEALLGMATQESILGNIDQSERLLDEATERFQASGATFSLARAASLRAEHLRNRKRPAEALLQLNKSVAVYEQYGNKLGLWWTLGARSATYQDLNRLSEALADAERNQHLARSIGLPLYLEQSTQRLAAIYAALGNYPLAYQYSHEAAAINAQISREKAGNHILELAERYQKESRQREVDELTRHNERQAAEQRWLWTVLLASMLLLTLTSFFLFRQRRAHRQLAALNARLQRSSNKLKATLDAVPDLLFELDLDGRYHDCRSPRGDLLAAPVSDLLGKTIDEVLPPDVAAICRAALREANENGISTGQQYALHLPHGTFWFEMSIARKTVPAGETPRFIGLSRDITERKQSEGRERIRLRTFELLAQGAAQQEILDLITTYVETERPDLFCSIMLADEQGKNLHPASAPRLPADYIAAVNTVPIGENIGSCGAAAWSLVTAVVEDINTHPNWLSYKHVALAAGLQSCWSEPIIGADGTLLGTVAIYRQQPGTPAESELELTRQSSHLAAVTIERTRMETALATSEREFRTLAENSPDNIGRYDAQCRGIYVNQRLAKTLGIDAKTGLGKTPREIDEINFADYQARLAAVIETGEAGDIEVTLPNTSEGTRHHHIRLVAERNEQGKIVGVLGIGRDITERKHIEAALAASEREFRTLAENMPDFISRYDTQCRKTYANTALLELIGGGVEAVLGKTPTETLPNNPAMSEYEEKLRRTLSSGRPENMDTVVSHGPRAGETHNLRFVAERATDGHIVGAMVISRDITERKRIEAALAASEREFRTLAENMPDFIARYDSHGRKTYLNNALIEMIGDTRAAQLGKTPFESLHGDMPGLEEYEEKLQRTLGSGQPESMNGIVTRGPRSGEIHNLRFIAERANDGRIVGALVFSRDISEIKKKERQIEESRDLLRELAARRDTAREEERKRIAREVHDELGQMLTAQRLDISTLKFQFGTDNATLGARCQHLLEITDQTIQVVRNVATALRPAALDMGIAPAMSWLSSEFRNRCGVTCDVLCDEDDIQLDEEQAIAVFRITQESLTNVARYAEARHVDISLTADGDHYHLSIRDDGKGFDAECPRRKSFGLIGIRERALMMGGEAQVVSAPGRGTAIEVNIPRHRTEKAAK